MAFFFIFLCVRKNETAIVCLSFSIEINTACQFPDSSCWYLYAFMYALMYAFMHVSFNRRNLINSLVFIIPGGLIAPVDTKPGISKPSVHLLSLLQKNVICVPKWTITIRFSSTTSPREVVWTTTSSISSHLTSYKGFLTLKTLNTWKLLGRTVRYHSSVSG